MGELERLAGLVGVEDELDQPGAVAQVDEDEPAVVAAAVDPAGDPDVGVDPVGEHLPAPGVAVLVRAQRREAPARSLSAQLLRSRPSREVELALLAARHVAELRGAVVVEDHRAARRRSGRPASSGP